MTCYKAMIFCLKNVNLLLMATFLQYIEQHGGHIKARLSYGLTLNRNLDSSVCVVTRPWPGDFVLSKASSLALGTTQRPLQKVLFALFLDVKQPGCEADQSLSGSAEIKNTWSCTSTPPYANDGAK